MASNMPKRNTAEDKIEAARKFKADGNDFHKTQQFKQAIGKYHRALLQLKAIGMEKMSAMSAFLSPEDQESMGLKENVSEETMTEMKKLSADCYNNLAGMTSTPN